jgi:iron complex transport system substrate-binding protein
MRLLVAFLGCYVLNCLAVAAVDSDGRRVALERPAQRIVSLAPHATEQLFAAGAGAKLVAVSEYSDYPEEAKRLPRVASSASVDLEALLALKPDLVVAWRLESTTAALARLEALGFAVFYSEPRRLAQIPDGIEALGELAGTADQARALANSLREQLNRLKAQYSSRRAVAVFYQIAERPLMTVGGRQFVSDAIELCGGRNVFAASALMAPQVNIEAVLAADPEAIITARPDPSDRSWQAFWRPYSGMRAVQANNLYAVPTNEMHRHGPRAVGATAVLCRHIHEARLKAASPR